MFVPPNFRLGYACICTELRKKGIFSSRTLRLATLESKGISYAQELATNNLTDLKSMLQWNKEHNISFMRLSSEIFPFATHEKFGYSLDFADNLLKDIGNYAKENNMRLTMHPAQFNVLSSPSEKVIKNTIKDLNHHCEILDKMGLDHNSVLIIHGGGVYGNKKESIDRLKQNFKLLSENTQKRLVLENCEISYTVEELLPVSEELQIPLVLDFHHDDLKNSSQPISFFFERVFKVWNDRGIKPKIHVSNSIPNLPTNASMTQKRKHSDYIYFFHEELLKIKFPIDVMLECKMKEQSILQFQQIEKQFGQSQIIEIKSNEIKQEIEANEIKQKTDQQQIVEIKQEIETEKTDQQQIVEIKQEIETQEIEIQEIETQIEEIETEKIESNENKIKSEIESMSSEFIKLNLQSILKQSKIDHKNEILKEKSLKNAHIYCKINKLSGQMLGPLIEYYLQYHLNLTKNNSSECMGDLNNGKTNLEIKASNGGKENNKFNYVQIRFNHQCDYILTAYNISEENIDNLGELFIFRLTKENMRTMIEKHGHYAHGTIKKLGKITKEELKNTENNKEYALRPKVGDTCWKDLLQFRIDVKDITT
jgi:UV DNA damage endonuclease